MKPITCLVLDGVNRTYETLEGLCTFRCEDGELAEAGTALIDTKDRHAALVGLSTCDFDKCNEQKCGSNNSTDTIQVNLPEITGLSGDQITLIILAILFTLCVFACVIYCIFAACCGPSVVNNYESSSPKRRRSRSRSRSHSHSFDDAAQQPMMVVTEADELPEKVPLEDAIGADPPVEEKEVNAENGEEKKDEVAEGEGKEEDPEAETEEKPGEKEPEKEVAEEKPEVEAEGTKDPEEGEGEETEKEPAEVEETAEEPEKEEEEEPEVEEPEVEPEEEPEPEPEEEEAEEEPAEEEE